MSSVSRYSEVVVYKLSETELHHKTNVVGTLVCPIKSGEPSVTDHDDMRKEARSFCASFRDSPRTGKVRTIDAGTVTGWI